MNNQEVQLSPCLECGGPRALFQYETYGEGASICLHLGFAKNVQLYACTCLECGATTLRPAPEKMEEFRQWAEKQKPFTPRQIAPDLSWGYCDTIYQNEEKK